MIQTQLINTRYLSFSLYFGFLVSGILTVLAGQVLPILSSRFSLTDTQAGYFFSAQFCGTIIGTLFTQRCIKRFGYVKTISAALIIILIGTLFLNSNAWILCLLAFFINGIGIGTTLPAINMLTVELNPESVTPSLNFLNFFWGIGAVICKPFVDFFATKTSIFQPTMILVALLFVSSFLLVFAPRKTTETTENDGETDVEFVPVWTTSVAWLIAAFNLVHVGFESGAIGWITTYGNRLPNQNGLISWMPPASAFFLFFIFGRFLAPTISRFMTENTMLLVHLLIATFGIIVMLLGSDLDLVIVGAAITGFGTSSIFPTNMARFSRFFGKTATRRTTPIFICGTIGASIITPLIGYVSTSYADLRIGMFVLFASCLILINLQIMLTMKTSKKLEFNN